jgi:hypothetical protein
MSMVNLVLLAENRLSLPAEDRVTALRVGFFVQFLMIVAWALAFVHAPGISPDAPLSMLGAMGGLHLAVVAIFTVTEDLTVSRRVFLQNQSSARWRGPIAIFRPGGGRGAAYVLAQMGILLIVGRIITPKPSDLRWLMAICGYICFFTGVVVCGVRRVAPERAKAKHLRVGSVLFLAAVMLLADLVSYMVTPSKLFTVDYSARHVFNPFRTLSNWPAAEANGWDLLALGLGIIGFALYAVLIQMGRGATRPESESSGTPVVQTAESVNGTPSN